MSLTNKQILSSKGQNSKRNDRNRNIVVINNIMHIYILYPKYLQSFMQFRAVIYEELRLQNNRTDRQTDRQTGQTCVLDQFFLYVSYAWRWISCFIDELDFTDITVYIHLYT